MKKLVLWLLSAAIVLSFGGLAAGCDKGNISTADRGNWTVKSPDGTITADLTFTDDGRMTYTVDKSGLTVVETSELGMDIAEEDFAVTAVDAVNSRRITGSYENKSGKRSKVDYDCNEIAVTLKGWNFYLDITMRCYDDGYAFRYGIRAVDGSSGTMTVLNEKTEFALPDRSNLWAQEYVSINPAKGEFFAYEVGYNRRSASGLTDEYLAMPVLYRVGSSDVYSLITESELVGSGYYGSYLKAPGDKSNEGILKTEHTPAGCNVDDNQVSYPFESPWRVGITGDMKTVNESELVEKVYDDVEYWKPDNYDELSEEEKAVYNYDWVDVDVSAWNWLVYKDKIGQNDYGLQREYVDLAAEMGWKYTILDGGWNSGFDGSQFAEFMKYADARGVKVIVWCNALSDFANGNADILRSKLEMWAKYGVAGIKIDFFDGQNATNPKHQGEDIDTIKWYETIYQETARLKMLVNCHGSNKPTGERRQYPHVINREGVLGNENKTVGASVTVNQMFVRNVVGPTDFTPVVKPFTDGLTAAHQLALSILYESGMPSMADYAETYADERICEFFKAIPALRDETVFLSGAPDEYYVAAVHSGDEWFVGGVNSVLESDVTVDFSFLGSGSYKAALYTDDEFGDEFVLENRTITKDDTLKLTMLERGGFVMRLTPEK